MPRGFRYSLTFRVQADIRPAQESLRRLQQYMNRSIGVGGAAPRLRAEQQQAAAIAGTTRATKDKQKASQGLFATMSRGLKVYWSIVSVFYLLRNVIRLVTDTYRQLWTVVQRGIGIMLGLGRAVLKNTAEFEMLRVKMQAIAPTAEMGSRAFEKLKRWVIGMPFTLKEAADAFTYLEATGVRAAMGLFRSMRVTATMAKVMDRDLKSAALAVAKFSAGYMQRLTRGFAITAAQLIPYGAVAGDKAGTLEYKAPGAAQANVEALYRFVESKWGSVLDRMRNTWQQLVNDMTDIWEQFTDAIGQAGVLTSLKTLVRYMRDVFEILRDKGVIDKWATAIADAWRPIIDMIGPWIEGLPDRINYVVAAIAELGHRTTDWLDKMGGIQGVWDKFIASMKEWGPKVISLFRVWFDIVNGIGQALTYIGSGVTGLAAWVANLWGGTEALTEASDALERLTFLQADLRKGVGGALDELAGVLEGKGFGKPARLPGLPGIAEKAAQYEKEAAGMLGGEARDAMKALTNIDEATKTGAKEGVKEGLEEVFGKAAAGRAGKEFNPFVALYEAMMGMGQPQRGQGGAAGYLADLQRRFAAAPGYRAGAAFGNAPEGRYAPSPPMPWEFGRQFWRGQQGRVRAGQRETFGAPPPLPGGGAAYQAAGWLQNTWRKLVSEAGRDPRIDSVTVKIGDKELRNLVVETEYNVDRQMHNVRTYAVP